ncbi:LacI family DNA-binding transcriptional regulator [Adhaeribacter radiodurans]|uniref:LacI family DNA-binding transcriptional regulator n=1 Tax=Adhaeribacter radiodurans TaxID=2745197 RepID=A0A7L7L2V9_9BACT|nr:LacI family DNA-binding transcriptional regulator [Adhaeribacter radiodurans]QMU27093.1 LacI family DNA-binding transcriptional regulator [Adhaeribacter radiodurans]
MYKPTTIKDIAKALGLSTSTVSRALRDSYEISEDTKRLVMDYAEKINYKPNPIALSLKERRSYSIGVIVCEVANSFFSQAINGIESIAYKKGYHVIISQSHDSYEREAINVQHLANRSVDGLLVSMSAETTDISHLQRLHEQGLPMVFFDRIVEEIQTHKVIVNNKKGAFEATEYLIKEGQTKIAHLANAPHLSITPERLEGYKMALQAYGLPFNEDYVQYCHHGGLIYEEVEDAVKKILQMPDKPDAIFVASDRLSTGCLTALRKFNPGNIHNLSIAGFSNSAVINLLQPSISYVHQPAFEMGQIAIEMLIQLIESNKPVKEFITRVLDTKFFPNKDLTEIKVDTIGS